MVPVPIGTKYVAVAAGSAPRCVKCEACGGEYVYIVERAAAAEATDLLFMNDSAAQARAQQDARTNLALVLEVASDPVPCPSCGNFQAAMVERLRNEQFQGLATCAMACFVLGPLLLIVAGIGWLFASNAGFAMQFVLTVVSLLAALILVAGLWLHGERRARLIRFNPNDEDSEARKRTGQRLAQTKDDYLKMLLDMRKKGMV